MEDTVCGGDGDLGPPFATPGLTMEETFGNRGIMAKDPPPNPFFWNFPPLPIDINNDYNHYINHHGQYLS